MQRRVQRTVQHGVQHHVRMSATHEKMFTAGEAAQGCGVSRTTISRAAAAGRIAGAKRDEAGAWVLPLSGLLAAGFNPGKPSPPEDEKHRGRDDSGVVDRDRMHKLELDVLRAEVREQRTRADGLERERDLYRLMLEQVESSHTRPESPQAAEHATPIPTHTPDPVRPSQANVGRLRRAWNVWRHG